MGWAVGDSEQSRQSSRERLICSTDPKIAQEVSGFVSSRLRAGRLYHDLRY